VTLTVGQAYRRARWYTVIAWLIAAACLVFYVLSALKAGAMATQHYAEWRYPFSWVGWAVQRAASFAYKLPGGSLLWESVTAMNPPLWLIRPEVVVSLVLLFLSGLMRRAASELRRGLQEALYAAQLARWQRELSGEQPKPVRSDQIGVQINLHQQLPVPPAPWWTTPWGLLAIAVVGGVASAVIAQWLNIQLCLVR
jgi:hypothetical protein